MGLIEFVGAIGANAPRLASVICARLSGLPRRRTIRANQSKRPATILEVLCCPWIDIRGRWSTREKFAEFSRFQVERSA
jgi:hypothetical protein